MRRLRGQILAKFRQIFGFLHLNRDPARPEGALLGQILPNLALGTPFQGSWGPPSRGPGQAWDQPWGPPKRAFPGPTPGFPVFGGPQGWSQACPGPRMGGPQGPQDPWMGGPQAQVGVSQGGTRHPRPLRWGPVYIEGFNMYTGVWRGSKCSGGPRFGLPRLKLSSPDRNGPLDRPVRPGLSSRDASTIRRVVTCS